MNIRSTGDRPVSPDRIQSRVRELGEWFHNMNLGGVYTAPHHFLGDYPNIKWKRFEHRIPPDLRGKTVLDIGCNAGFYSIEMKRRGADRVVGSGGSIPEVDIGGAPSLPVISYVHAPKWP